MDIPHILYNTIGSDFEKFLGPKDLLTMSKVSKTTREGDLSTRFRHFLDVTRQEFEIFKKNNKVGVTMDDFLKNIPLGVIYKDHILEPGTDFNMLLDYFNCNKDTRIAIFLELAPLNKFKEYINGLHSGETELEPEEQEAKLLDEYSDYISQASIRGRDDIIEYLIEDKRIDYNLYHTYYKYYPASQRLRDLFVKHETEIIDVLQYEFGMGDPDAFGIINTDWERVDTLQTTVWLTTCFQEQDMFIKYYLKHRKFIPDYLRIILEDKSLKYNINKYNPVLLPILGADDTDDSDSE
jgi:hypothetical protein